MPAASALDAWWRPEAHDATDLGEIVTARCGCVISGAGYCVNVAVNLDEGSGSWRRWRFLSFSTRHQRLCQSSGRRYWHAKFLRQKRTK